MSFLSNARGQILSQTFTFQGYMSDTNGGEFDRVIISYDFDTESFEEESKCHYFHM
jgi:hypothetical protein